MTWTEPALPTATRQLVLGRSALTLMAAETPPWVSTRSRTTRRTSSPPLVLMRYLPTRPAPGTRQLVRWRSVRILPAAPTQPTVMPRFVATPQAPTTRPTVIERSIATPPAVTTRPAARSEERRVGKE